MTGIVILNYNNAKDTIICVESIKKINTSKSDYFIIIVDNKSTTDEFELLFNSLACDKSKVVENFDHGIENIESTFQIGESLFLIRSSTNLGYAGGNNLGIKFCLFKVKTDYFWILNNDTTVDKESLNELISVSKDFEDNALVGSSLFDYNNHSIPQAYFTKYNKFLGVTKSVMHDFNGVLPKENLFTLSYLVGASFLFSMSVFRTLKYLPEIYFLYYEDIEFCTTAKKMGMQLVVSNRSLVYHKTGGTTNNGLKVKSNLSDYYYIRNKLLFTRRNYPNYLIFIYISLVITFFKRLILNQRFSVLTFSKAILGKKY